MSDYLDDHGYVPYVQRSVNIRGEGINGYLDTGLDAIRYLTELIEEDRIKNAKSIKKVDAFNCDVIFMGSDLLDFLKEFYPNMYEIYADDIKPENEYWVSAVDLS